VPGKKEELARQGYEVLNRGDVDRFVTEFVHRARGRGSGAPVDSEYAHILTFHDGLCLRVDGFPTWKRALAAAGLAE
jgi:ketosteroid isomerase-like protein